MPKKNLMTYRAEYGQLFSDMGDPYAFAVKRELLLDEDMRDAEERIKAFPNEKSEHDALIQLVMDGLAMWEECERRLRAIAGSGSVDRTAIASQINQSHEKTKEYEERFSAAIQNSLSNTSELYKAGMSIQATAQTMQNAGNAMKSVGHAMTVGCTIPIILLVLILLLFGLL